MHSRDRLHLATVAIPQTDPVNGLHPAHVGIAVAGDGNLMFFFHQARHARHPQQLVIDLSVGELMQVAEKLESLPISRIRRCHELQ